MSTPAADEPVLTGFAFVSDPLDRADHVREDADALRRLWPQARVMVLTPAGEAWADAAGQLAVLHGRDVGEGPGEAVFLGLQAQVAWFAVAADGLPLQAARQVDLRHAAVSWPGFQAGAFALARAMLHWRGRTRFCGVCGAQVVFRRAGYQGQCAGCGAEHYPRVDPAVIVAVSDGERLLLGRQAAWPAQRYSVLAGFVEPGETLEQTVVREVREETGVRVRQCHYLGSQPWPFPGALMVGFCAEAEPDVPQVNDELEDARWFSVEEIAAARVREDERGGEGLRLSPSISISRALIEHWYARMCQRWQR